MKRRNVALSALVLCGGISISGGIVDKVERKKEDLVEYYNPVVCEILFVDLLFDELISHLSEEEVLEIRRVLAGVVEEGGAH